LLHQDPKNRFFNSDSGFEQSQGIKKPDFAVQDGIQSKISNQISQIQKSFFAESSKPTADV
jgi:hypothetical protein